MSAGESCASCARRKRERKARVVETPELASAAVRMVKALGKRSAFDPTGLPELVQLARLVDEQLHAAVAGAVAEHGWTWQTVADELGVTRQSAHKRFAASVRALEATLPAPAADDADQGAAAG